MAKNKKDKKPNPVAAFLWKDKRRRAKNFYFLLMLIIALAAVDKLHKENEELKDRLKKIEEKLGL